MRATMVVLAAVVLVVAGCAGSPFLANAPVLRPSPPATPTRAPEPPDPVAVAFPRDDGPHDRLTEWWYYTGHLRAADGRRFGFEFVVFRAERGDLPVSWASHLAVTDESDGAFHYAQRSEIGPQVDQSPRDAASGLPTGFDLAVGGALQPATAGPVPSGPVPSGPVPSGPAPAPSAPVSSDVGPSASPSRSPSASSQAPDSAQAQPWSMAGSGGLDRLQATMSPAEAVASGAPAGLGLDLRLASTKPPALHDGDGFVDFGPAGGSYYYSRTRMTATGSIVVDGSRLQVDGIAWFDHQWGDFISVGGGGWDWFAVNLDDGSDLTLSLVRAASGTYPLVYGTFVDAAGAAHHLDRTAFTVTTSRTWTSPTTRATYPAAWHISLPSRGLEIDLAPAVAAQELDTRATSGVIYWEGSQKVTARIGARPIGGQAYVELTGYAT